MPYLQYSVFGSKKKMYIRKEYCLHDEIMRNIIVNKTEFNVCSKDMHVRLSKSYLKKNANEVK